MSDRLDCMLTAMIMACGVSKLSFKFNLLTKTASEPSKKFDLSDLNIEKIVWFGIMKINICFINVSKVCDWLIIRQGSFFPVITDGEQVLSLAKLMLKVNMKLLDVLIMLICLIIGITLSK